MSEKDRRGASRAELLSQALKAVRDIRKARSEDLAAALGLSLRGYQHFQSGGGQLNIEHVLNFGSAIDCDPFGVLAGVQIGIPEFAAYTARNKAMLAFVIELQAFVEETGAAIDLLETSTFISAYRNMFRELNGEAMAAQRRSQAWHAGNAERLGLPARTPRDGDVGGDEDAEQASGPGDDVRGDDAAADNDDPGRDEED